MTSVINPLSGDFSTELNQTLNRFAQGCKDESKFKRKAALEQIKKQLVESFNATTTSSVQFSPESLKTVLRLTLSELNDQMEKCREIADEIVDLMIESDKGDSYWDADMSAMTLMAIYQRIGGKDIKEPSEEIRLKLITTLRKLIELKSSVSDRKSLGIFESHLTELVGILNNSFNDPFAEVKKEGCTCCRLVASRLAGSNFHMQSEQLMKELLGQMTHQHSRVRKEVVECLCDVMLHGNNKQVGDCVPHLAQRLFDQASIVRSAVIKLSGTWLLDLPDRYSFHHRLIPLLLTGLVDEANEIRDLAESLWWDVGVKYEKENEQDLKDKSDFLSTSDPAGYPAEFKDRRPNLGCRELIRLNASKIIPGILNDVSDWVEGTRIKSIQLLYVIIWQAERNVIQHLELVLQSLFKASGEYTDPIQSNIYNCSRLIGHFTEPDVAMQFVFKTTRRMSIATAGAINILHGLLVGFANTKLPFSLAIDTLDLLNEICITTDTQLHVKILNCASVLTEIRQKAASLESNEDLNHFEYLFFRSVFAISSLTSHEAIQVKSADLLKHVTDPTIHLNKFVSEFKSSCSSWNDNSLEPIIFAKLVQTYGLRESIIGTVNEILETSLDPARDPQLKTRFLLLAPQLFLQTEQHLDVLQSCVDSIVNKMLIPNMMWRAGRAASAVRMAAVSSLALFLDNDLLVKIKIEDATLATLVKMIQACLDDDNKETRLNSCYSFYNVLDKYGKQITVDELHKLYLDFIKRLDDQNEAIRLAIIQVFKKYSECLKSHGAYDKVLYQAHVQTIDENLILYLDDSNAQIQSNIFEVLKGFATLGPEIMLTELEKARGKQRNSELSKQLTTYCQSLVSSV